MASQPPTNPFQIPDPSSLLNDVTDAIPGAGFILDIVKAVGDLPGLLTTLIQQVESAHPLDWVTLLADHLGKVKDTLNIADMPIGQQITAGQSVPTLGQAAGSLETSLANLGKPGTPAQEFKAGAGNTWKWFAQHTVGYFYTDLLGIGLGVDVNQFDDAAQQGVNTVDSMLGFTFALQFIVAVAETFSTGLFAGRWGKALKHTIADIPTDMGLSWALGLTLDEAFKTAVGRSIEEGINRQKRPNRIAWQQLRVLLKQHILTPEQLHGLLINQGFPDEQIEWLNKLADTTIPVGDISQLYYREKIDKDEAKELIGELGFNDRDTQHILELYVTKAETQASVTYRSIAKQMYVNHLLSETQYRAILTESNFPSRMIDADIAGISLEQTVGHVLETVALVKTEYLHKRIDPAEAARRLALLNYAPSYITDLIASWDLPAIKAKHGLSTAKVLSYMISGLLTPDQARPMLQANGVDDTTVEFLLLHPTANTGAKQHALSPGLVTQAYMDGAVSLPDLAAAYKRAGVPDSSLDYYLNIAKYKFSHKRGNAGYTQTLGTGDYKSAYKYGLLDFPGLVTSLESIGWRPDDALLLAEIENKGPYQPAQPPAFATLSAALAYLQQAGFTLHTPTDPRLLAAENMAAVAGYTWSPPPTPVGGSEVLPPVTDPGPGTQTGGFTLP